MLRHKNSSNCLIFELKFLSHVMYQCKMIKLFLEIFTRLKRIFRNIFNMFFRPRTVLTGQVGRPDGRPNQGPVDRCGRLTCTALCTFVKHKAGRPVGRPNQRALLSISGRSTERSTGAEKSALCIWAVGRAVDRIAQRSYFWPLAVDRPVDRKPVRLPDQSNG